MEAQRRTASYLLSLFALLWIAMIVASEFSHPPYTFDATLRGGADPTVLAVSPAVRRAGLRPGDVVLLSRMSFAQVLRSRRGYLNATAPILVSRNGRTAEITVPLTQSQDRIPFPARLPGFLAALIALAMTAYLGFRKPSAMIAALTLFIGGAYLSWGAFVMLFDGLPDPVYIPLAIVLADVCGWFPVAALASFVIRLPGGEPGRAQLRAIRIVDAFVVVAFAIGLFPQAQNAFVLCCAVSAIVVFALSLAVLRIARPADRARVGIVVIGVMIGGVGYAINMIALRFGAAFWLSQVYTELAIIIVTGSLAYAILRHRIFDVAFVLNQTIIYAITSALVLLVFAGLEFGVERYLSDLTHVEGLAVQFGIALAVIVSLRIVHGRVDRAVDTVLFRERHQQETALRRFAETLQFYTDDAPLIRDAVDAMLRYARVQGAAIYVAGARGLTLALSAFPAAAPEIDENDTAFVELRAHHDVLHVHDTPTAFPGARLYPMILAGRVVGVIASGERESHEVMPPDIEEAIRRVAQAVGITLAAIDTERVRAENAALQARFAL